MVATGSPGRPEGQLFAGASGVVSGGQSGKAAAGQSELRGGLRRVQSVSPECVENMADKRGRVTMDELLVFFKRAGYAQACLQRPATVKSSTESAAKTPLPR